MENKLQNMKYQPGEVIVITNGCYSDFSLTGFIVSLKSFDMITLAQEFLVGKEAWSHYYSYDSFIGWLIANEYAAPVKYREAHFGDYRWANEFNIEEGDDGTLKVKS